MCGLYRLSDVRRRHVAAAGVNRRVITARKLTHALNDDPLGAQLLRGIMRSLSVLALLLAGSAIAQVPTWPQTWQMNKRCVADSPPSLGSSRSWTRAISDGCSTPPETPFP